MDKRNTFLMIFCCAVFGVFAIYFFYQIYELVVLKSSNELIEGNIEKIEHESTGKSWTDWLICTIEYRNQTYTKKIFISSGIPFITQLSKEYPKGKTIFLFNYEKDIIFPKDNINTEIIRRIFPLMLFSVVLIVSIIIFRRSR